jgi:hypothetical protein
VEGWKGGRGHTKPNATKKRSGEEEAPPPDDESVDVEALTVPVVSEGVGDIVDDMLFCSSFARCLHKAASQLN